MRAAADNLLQHDLTSASGPLTPDTLREFYLIISEEVGRLTRLVNNLLEMARIEAGELRLAKEWTLVSEVFGNVVERCSPVLVHHTALANVDDQMPLVKIDSRLIAEALVNIVENAAKYCPARAEIKLEARKQDDDLLINVTDNGPGIAPQELDRVFDKFYRSPSVTESSAAGTGMGLAIARGIIVAHGGRVWAESSKGHGTIITLAIPVESKSAEPADSGESADSVLESSKSASSADESGASKAPGNESGQTANPAARSGPFANPAGSVPRSADSDERADTVPGSADSADSGRRAGTVPGSANSSRSGGPKCL